MSTNVSLQQSTVKSKPSFESFHNGKVGRRLRSRTLRNILLIVLSVVTVINLSAVTEVIAPRQEALINQLLNQRAAVVSNKMHQLRSTIAEVSKIIPSSNESQSNSASSAQTNNSLNQPILAIRNRNAVSVASHVLQRDSNSQWTPLPELLTDEKQVDRAFFSTPMSLSNTNVTTNEHLGVVRIPKTGSTSLLTYFNRAKGLQTFDKYVRDAFLESLVGPRQKYLKFYSLPCVHGYHGGNISKAMPFYDFQCQHLSYPYLIKYWTSSLHYLKDDLGINHTLPLRVSLDLTTIVREPVERYLSYFHYWRTVYPYWNATAKPLERSALVSGDFPWFLREVAFQKRRGLNSAFQYEYFSPDANDAIALVENLRILPLVNECFNASILLLAEHYPQFFSLNETIAFLTSEALNTNSRSSHKNRTTPDALAKRGLQPVQEFNLEHVKAEAREWLADDYRFYDASVSVFLRLLQQASNTTVVPSVVQECVQQIASSSKLAPISATLTTAQAATTTT